MKRTLKRSWIIFILVIAFLLGMVFLVVETLFGASDWVDQPYNGHTAGAGGLLEAGVISDRTGNVLAQTVDNKRVYNDDKAIRKALLHVVGDDSSSISTAIQSQFRSQLTGYSFIWGLNLPDSFRGGRDVNLTVDADTCKVAYNALKQYPSGACVIYNYRTGEIICDVSTKTYDPANPPKITKKNEKKWEGVYLDNVLSSTYTPGSIFKIVTAAAAIENNPDIWNKTWTCTGEAEIVPGGTKVYCAEHEAHGTVTLKEAFAKSCNVVFARIAAEDVGEAKMTETAKKLGITDSYSISGIKTKAGNYDVSNTTDTELAFSGIGQYSNKVNPMQMAILCGAIANKGTPILPYLVDSSSGSKLKDMGLSGSATTGKQMMSPSTADGLKTLMSAAQESYNYSYQYYYGENMFNGLTVCSKTGTGEISTQSLDGKDLNDNWMVGFSTDSDCPLAYACVVHEVEKDYSFGVTSKIVKAAMTQAAQSLRNKK